MWKSYIGNAFTRHINTDHIWNIIMHYAEYCIFIPHGGLSLTREHSAVSNPALPHAAWKGLFREMFSTRLYHISRGGLIQPACCPAPLHPLTERPNPSPASGALIITGAPQSVIYKSKTL